MSSRLAHSEAPERLSQAQTFDKTRNFYAAIGMCNIDAAALSWGHQLGWTRLERTPCSDCAPLVASLPTATAVPAWRNVPRNLRRHARKPLSRRRTGTTVARGPLTCPASLSPMTGHTA